jgi:hypothetical protein
MWEFMIRTSRRSQGIPCDPNYNQNRARGLGLLARGPVHMLDDQEPARTGASAQVEHLATWSRAHMTRGIARRGMHPYF